MKIMSHLLIKRYIDNVGNILNKLDINPKKRTKESHHRNQVNEEVCQR